MHFEHATKIKTMISRHNLHSDNKTNCHSCSRPRSSLIVLSPLPTQEASGSTCGHRSHASPNHWPPNIPTSHTGLCTPRQAVGSASAPRSVPGLPSDRCARPPWCVNGGAKLHPPSEGRGWARGCERSKRSLELLAERWQPWGRGQSRALISGLIPGSEGHLREGRTEVFLGNAAAVREKCITALNES